MFKRQLISFVQLTGVFLIFLAFVLFMKAILYKSDGFTSRFEIYTSEIDKKYYVPVLPGDEILDSVTKRRVGYVTAIDVRFSEASFTLRIEAVGDATPSANALMCSGLWLERQEAKNA